MPKASEQRRSPWRHVSPPDGDVLALGIRYSHRLDPVDLILFTRHRTTIHGASLCSHVRTRRDRRYRRWTAFPLAGALQRGSPHAADDSDVTVVFELSRGIRCQNCHRPAPLLTSIHIQDGNPWEHNNGRRDHWAKLTTSPAWAFFGRRKWPRTRSVLGLAASVNHHLCNDTGCSSGRLHASRYLHQVHVSTYKPSFSDDDSSMV